MVFKLHTEKRDRLFTFIAWLISFTCARCTPEETPLRSRYTVHTQTASHWIQLLTNLLHAVVCIRM